MQATSLTNTSPPPPRHLDVQGPRVKSEQKSFEVMRKGLFCSIERLDATLCPLLGYGELLVDKRNSIFVLVTALMLATVVPSAVALVSDCLTASARPPKEGRRERSFFWVG